jgi:glucose/arabinose dehydrogenase
MNGALSPRRAMMALGAAALVSCGGDGGVTGGTGGTGGTGVPVVTLTAPANFASGLTGNVALTADARDDVAVTLVEFEVDGVPVGSDSSAPYAAAVDTSSYAAGQHIVRVRARDAAGTISAWTTATVHFGGNNTVPSGFVKNESFVTGLVSATAMAQASDGHLFIAQQGGVLRVFKGTQLLGLPFVQLAVDSAGERGLIGVALHPNFPIRPLVYVHYTTTAAAPGGTHNRISRFTAVNDVAAPLSEEILVELPALSGATNHNGGAIHFGIDGKLYVAVGENANAALSQDLTSPFGKLLRFNEDGSIPSDNPFCNRQQDLACAIWAYGLRNPFTFAVQPGTGRIHINDVGEETWEEINVGTAGANYGWPSSEGPDNLSGNIVAPLFAYRHSAASPPGSGPGGFFTGISTAGGAFYPTTGNFPAPYRENYFFADFVSKFIGRLDAANGNAAYAFASITDSPVDMLVGIDGALYVLGRSSVTRISAP